MIPYSNSLIYVFIFCGANVNQEDRYKRTPLSLAVKFNLTEMVNLFLLQENIDLNTIDKFYITPLIEACYNCNWSMAKLLLSHPKINVNLPGHNFRTALMYATLFGQVDMVKLLLAKNANRELRNDQGETALDIAKRRKRIEIVHLLNN